MPPRKSTPSHRGLIVWNKSMDLVDLIYDLAETLPKRERYGICTQLTNAATSIPSNISEGRGRGAAADFARFLDMAKGSVSELDTFVQVCVRRRFCSAEDVRPIFDLMDEVSAMLHAMRTKLRAPGAKHPT